MAFLWPLYVLSYRNAPEALSFKLKYRTLGREDPDEHADTDRRPTLVRARFFLAI
jgi:hypothetical protein